jgi:hypothetical protein
MMVAIHAAKLLRRKGVLRHVVVKRAGTQHVPKFSDEDRLVFNKYTEGMPHTATWDGQSPRVVFDGDPHSAMGASPFLQRYAEWFNGPSDFDITSMRDDLWQMALTTKALPIVAMACMESQSASTHRGFFSVHPAGKPLHGVTDANKLVEYHDVDVSTATYADHSLDPSADPALAAICEQVAVDFGLEALQRGLTNFARNSHDHLNSPPSRDALADPRDSLH